MISLLLSLSLHSTLSYLHYTNWSSLCICVASGGHPGVPGCSCLSFSGILVGYFRLACVGRAASDAHHLSLRCCIVSNTVMSCMTSWCHTCMGHVTFGYKSSQRAWFEALSALKALRSAGFSVHQARPWHPHMAGVQRV